MMETSYVNVLALGINTGASITVIWSTICALNYMTSKTPFFLRIAYLLIGVGAGAALLAPGYLSRPPTVAETFLVAGVALMGVTDRRRKSLRKLIRNATTNLS